jgi:hypothetical protein
MQALGTVYEENGFRNFVCEQRKKNCQRFHEFACIERKFGLASFLIYFIGADRCIWRGDSNPLVGISERSI